MQRETILRGVIQNYYASVGQGEVVIDTNRIWCAKLPLLSRLFPAAKVVACVRDIGWIMDSVERHTRTNVLEPSRIFCFDPGGTVFGRVQSLAASDGMVGFALDALREGFFDEQDRLMLVTYETLTAEPARTLAAVYEFLGLPAFAHDFDNVVFDADEFDRRLGAPGLHRVRRRVAAQERRTVLPPGLFASFEGDAFWRQPAANTRGVRVV